MKSERGLARALKLRTSESAKDSGHEADVLKMDERFRLGANREQLLVFIALNGIGRIDVALCWL